MNAWRRGTIEIGIVHTMNPYCYRCPLGLERATCGIACVEELCRLLEAGINVCSTAGWITGGKLPDSDLDRVRKSAERGGASMFGSGAHPGFTNLISIVVEANLKLFPSRILVVGAIWSLVEKILAVEVGAWLYKEEGA